MTRHWSRVALRSATTAALLLLYCLPARAQSPTTGGLAGVIRDGGGEPVRDVFITLVDMLTGLKHETFSDRFGAFHFPLLSAGDYDLTAEKLAFGPRRVVGIPIRPGREQRLTVQLMAVRGGVEVTEERFARAVLSGTLAGAGQWVPEYGVVSLPSARRDVSELARLSSQTSDDLAVEGLPPWLSAVAIDGVTFRPAAHPYMWDARFRSTGFALGGVSTAELLTNPTDVEWTGVAGGVLSAHSRRGTPVLRADARGHWSGSALPGPSFVDGSSLTYNDLQGGAGLRGPLLADSARVSIGVEVRRLETPVSAQWSDSPAAAALIGAGDGAGIDLSANRLASVAPAEAVSGFGRFDWSISSRHQLAGWLHFASLPRITGVDPLTGRLPLLEGSDLIGGASLFSMIADRAHNDLRVTITTSSRITNEIAPVAPTTVVSDGLAFGGARATVSGEETQVQFRNALQYRGNGHELKAGAAATIVTNNYNYRQGLDGEFFFGGISDLTARRGVLVRTEGPGTTAQWTSAIATFFVQDRWTASEGVEVLLGAQVERQPLPEDVTLDTEWQRLAGLANNQVELATWRPGVRAGLTWDVRQSHDWVVYAGAGVYYDRFDPLMLSQWQIDAGDGRVRRDVGTVSWPQPSAGGSLRRLTMLAQEFAPPRTARVSAGFMRQLTPHTALHASAALRRTDNLPRRTDLNLLPLPVARDQYGRSIYGTLSLQGTVLAALPTSNRRFESYDEVAGITTDAQSEHWGITVGIEREPAAGFGFLARYTYGRTTDNWFAAREGGWTAPLPQGLDSGGEWAQGTSDYDIPHRAVAAFSIEGPAGTSLGAAYRFQSGQPFTPGHGVGIDANGDGDARHDPAFVDAAFTGMTELMNEWSCLRESSGRIAQRNACRGEATHALDVSFGWRLLRVGSTAATLMIDAFDLLDSERAAPDNALYLITPGSTLQTDPIARTVHVPLMLNPNFGQELIRPHGGRKLRLGISLNW